jgi:hypothetical protein
VPHREGDLGIEPKGINESFHMEHIGRMFRVK